MKPTPCECPQEGYCKRHNVDKPGRLYFLCQTRRDYFDLWEAGNGPGQSPGTSTNTQHLRQPCVHFGEKLREVRCRVGCKSKRGMVGVHQCGVHGECSEKRYKNAQQMAFCPCDEFRPTSPTDAMLAELDAPLEGVAVGVTTCPRPRGESYLAETCKSIIANGIVPHIIAEPETNVEGLEALPIHFNDRVLGAWFNWIKTCEVLLETGEPIIVTVQDDTVFAPCAFSTMMEWVNRTNWMGGGAGTFGLYTSRKYHKADRNDAHRVKTVSLWGACAMAFPRDVLAAMLEHPIAKKWRGAAFKTRKRPREDVEVGNVDTAIGKILNAMKLQMWFHSPSLSQHVGDVSAMGHGNASGNRIAREVIEC